MNQRKSIFDLMAESFAGGVIALAVLLIAEVVKPDPPFLTEAGFNATVILWAIFFLAWIVFRILGAGAPAEIPEEKEWEKEREKK